MSSDIQKFELRPPRHDFLKFKKRANAATNTEPGCAAVTCTRPVDVYTPDFAVALPLVEEGRLLAVVGKRE
jgi:hypothetical protein